MVFNITIGDMLGILSGIVLLISGYIILRQIKQGPSTPNLITWLVNLLMGLMNAISFYKVVHENIYQGIIMFASVILLAAIFFYSLTKGKFAKLKPWDFVIFSLAIFVGVLWKFTDDRLANFLVQIVICIANSATFIGLWRGTLREYYLGWAVAVSAYLIAITGLILNSNGDWLPFFGPLLNGVLGNGIVLCFAVKQNLKNKKSWKQKLKQKKWQ